MEVKLFEIRDRMTFIPAMAVRLEWSTPEEHFLFRRAGFGNKGMTRANDVPPYIILTKLTDIKSQYDPYAWDNVRFQVAHAYISTNWDDLRTGAIVDVEFILGESTSPAVSERLGGGI